MTATNHVITTRVFEFDNKTEQKIKIYGVIKLDESRSDGYQHPNTPSQKLKVQDGTSYIYYSLVC